jgi:hypothetical protein
VIEADLVAHLLADAGVAALVETRVYPERFPPGGPMPAVTYQRVFGAEGVTHDGPDGLARARFQVDCWAASYGEAAALGEAVSDALKAFPGARLINEMDMPEPDVALRRRMIEVSIWHQES